MFITFRDCGKFLSKTGAAIWERNSRQFDGDMTIEETWSELNLAGKIGFKIMTVGFWMMGITPNDVFRK